MIRNPRAPHCISPVRCDGERPPNSTVNVKHCGRWDGGGGRGGKHGLGAHGICGYLSRHSSCFLVTAGEEHPPTCISRACGWAAGLAISTFGKPEVGTAYVGIGLSKLSVVYLSQSNGRAEVAGRQLFERLRKIHLWSRLKTIW